MKRWCGHARAAPTGLAVVTMGTNMVGSLFPHVEASGTMLVCRPSDGTLRRTPAQTQR